MKLKNSIFVKDKEGAGFISALNNLLGQKLPVGMSFVLFKFAKEVNEKGESYEKARMKIWETYGKLTENEDGSKTWIIPKGKKLDAANKEFEELAAIEEEYPSLSKKITLPEKVEISVRDLGTLEPIVELE